AGDTHTHTHTHTHTPSCPLMSSNPLMSSHVFSCPPSAENLSPSSVSHSLHIWFAVICMDVCVYQFSIWMCVCISVLYMDVCVYQFSIWMCVCVCVCL